MAGIKLSGLLGTTDWQSIVDSLMEVERYPITRLQTEQAKNSTVNDALTLLNTKMGNLQDSINKLKTATLYTGRGVSSSVSGSSWGLSASNGATTGFYKFSVSQLASAAQLKGSANVGSALSPTTPIASLPTAIAVKAGTFTVNGTQINIALDDTLNDVLGKIHTAVPAVTATYESGTDTIKFTTSGGSNIVLGSANDTSNFMTAMHLRNNGTDTVSSSTSLGATSLISTIENSRLSTPLSGQSTAGDGTLVINGVTIAYNTKTESLGAILSKINASGAGVTASYDSVRDSFSLVNNTTGDVGFSAQDGTGNLLAAMGLTSGSTLVSGKDAIFSVDGGGSLYSHTNTLDSSVHGIAGLSVTVKSESAETITVTADTSAATSAVQDMISKFNDVQDYIDEKTKITTTNGKVTTSVLSSNTEVNAFASRMRSLAFSAISGLTGSVDQLDDLGIDFRTGTNKLELKDSSKLSTALTNKASDVQDFFTNSTNSFTTKFSDFFKSTLGTETADGSMDRMMKAITTANTGLDKQIADIERRLEAEREKLESAYQAMENAQLKANNILTQLSKSFYSS